MERVNNYAEMLTPAIGCDIESLKKNVANFPASSVARFLLLYYQKKNNDPDFEKTITQFGLYTNNPLWAQYQLPHENNVAQSQNISHETLSFEKPGETVPVEIINGDTEVAENNFEPINNDNNPVLEDPEVIAKTETHEESLPPQEIISANNNYIDNSFSQNDQSTPEESTITEALPENEITLQKEEPANEESIKQNEDLDIPPHDIENTFETVPEKESIEHIEEDNSGDKTGDVKQENIENVEIQDEVKENSDFHQQATEEQEPAHENEELAFEPLHTVDYFASQGIKISEEALGNDTLGKQVKSFTSWLKSMKKLHPGQLPEQNEVIERIIRSSAESSNNEANILTEAMAEVLVKQDKREKAVEMYQKLSLLNPSKSAYFAAKIESLKST